MIGPLNLLNLLHLCKFDTVHFISLKETNLISIELKQQMLTCGKF